MAPPTRPGDGVRIPGIAFAHFILTGLFRRRAGTLDVCLDNLARHADATVRGINGWRRKNDRWVQRAIPDGAMPLNDPATTARFFLETQFPALMKLGTAIAHFDSVFAEVAAATEIAKDVRVWNPNLEVLPRSLRRDTVDPVRRAGVPEARPAATGRCAPTVRPVGPGAAAGPKGDQRLRPRSRGDPAFAFAATRPVLPIARRFETSFAAW